MNHSTGPKESSEDGSVTQFPSRLHVVEMSAGDAIASVAVALISYVLLPENTAKFLAWYLATTDDNTMTNRDLIADLTAVREALGHMGYEFP